MSVLLTDRGDRPKESRADRPGLVRVSAKRRRGLPAPSSALLVPCVESIRVPLRGFRQDQKSVRCASRARWRARVTRPSCARSVLLNSTISRPARYEPSRQAIRPNATKSPGRIARGSYAPAGLTPSQLDIGGGAGLHDRG